MMDNYDVKVGPREWDFVPEFGDGKIKTRLRQLTVEEYNDCLNLYSERTLDRAQMVKYGLVSIKGLTVGGVAVTNAEELLAAGKDLMPLFSQLWLEVNRASVVTEEEAKNS